MQQVERRDVSKKGLSPVKGLLIVAALALAGGAFLLLSNNNPEPTTRNTTNAPTTLTNTEAINVFKQRSDMLIAAVRDKNPEQLGNAAIAGSPVYERALQSIHELERKNSSDQSVLKVISLNAVSRSSTNVQILEINEIDPCFVSQNGEDVTERHVVTRQEILWTLRPEDSVWLISDAEVKDQEVLEKRSGPCP